MSTESTNHTRPLSLEERFLRMVAREAVVEAVRSGQLTREPCERCGDISADAHHDDYSKPLEVRWLCRLHHRKVHREIGAPMGRRLRAGAPTKLVTIRATDAERERWEAAAIRQRLSLSDMLREQANATASQMENHAPPGAWAAALREARRKRKTNKPAARVAPPTKSRSRR